MTSERDALRKAIADRDAAKEAVRVASDIADRGKEMLRVAKRKLEQFGDVDGAINQHRAASFKAAAKGGPKPSLALPPELLKREQGRDLASSEVAAARDAHSSLVGEFAEAQAALRRAESKVHELAGQVLIAETAEEGLTLMACWHELWDRYDSLRGLSTSGVQLSQQAVFALQSFASMDHRQFAGGRNEQFGRAVEFWKQYRSALCDSADATNPIDGGTNTTAVDNAA
jgi:hypothetical protein